MMSWLKKCLVSIFYADSFLIMLSGEEEVLCEGTSLLFGPRMSALWSLQTGGHIDNKNIFCSYEIFLHYHSKYMYKKFECHSFWHYSLFRMLHLFLSFACNPEKKKKKFFSFFFFTTEVETALSFSYSTYSDKCTIKKGGRNLVYSFIIL